MWLTTCSLGASILESGSFGVGFLSSTLAGMIGLRDSYCAPYGCSSTIWSMGTGLGCRVKSVGLDRRA